MIKNFINNVEIINQENNFLDQNASAAFLRLFKVAAELRNDVHVNQNLATSSASDIESSSNKNGLLDVFVAYQVNPEKTLKLCLT